MQTPIGNTDWTSIVIRAWQLDEASIHISAIMTRFRRVVGDVTQLYLNLNKGLFLSMCQPAFSTLQI